VVHARTASVSLQAPAEFAHSPILARNQCAMRQPTHQCASPQTTGEKAGKADNNAIRKATAVWIPSMMTHVSGYTSMRDISSATAAQASGDTA
jgi:hypothetical protein